MKILVLGKYPPIQGGVSIATYWTVQFLAAVGHEITVVTNAQEVEDSSRVELDADDREKLLGFWKPRSVRVVSTITSAQESFIPQYNPMSHKLLSLGLTEVERERPDFIWSYYFEPYGMVAMQLSLLTGIPYSVMNAGSDIGRLIESPQLAPAYQQMLKHAQRIYSAPRHWDNLVSNGANREHLRPATTLRLPGDLFEAHPSETGRDRIALGIYGKVGKSKGTPQLIKALGILEKRGVPVRVCALWGGPRLNRILELVQDVGVSPKTLTVNGYIPHWKIPAFIHGTHGVLFLENNFFIPYHTPGIPREVSACGRQLITTAEIAEKAVSSGSEANVSVIPTSAVTPEGIAMAIERFVSSFDGSQPEVGHFDASTHALHVGERLNDMIQDIEQTL